MCFAVNAAMSHKLYGVYFNEVQNIKDSFDHDEPVEEDVGASVPDG